jgi:hypothetical protein
MNVLNHTILDFYKEIYLPSEIDILNNLYDQGYNLSELNIHSNFYKILFFNYISKNYIDQLMNSSEKKFYIIGKPDKNSHLLEYVDYLDFKYSYMLNMNKIFKLYPINALITDKYTYDEYLEENDGELYELFTHQIISCKEKNSKKNFKNLKSFLNTYELIYLDKQIFQKVQNKFMFS